MSKKPKHASALKVPKAILRTGKFLSSFSTSLTTLFAARLFTTPLRHKLPKRELEMDANSEQSLVMVPELNKKIMVYRIGNGSRNVLLVHGWSGRGTQLVKFAEALVRAGYTVTSFDAPAHGKSQGKTTLMPDFIASILHLEKIYGPFDAAVGHSLGGMSLLNAMRQGLKLKGLVIIGSGDIVQDIIDDFIYKLELPHKYSSLMRKHFEKKSGEAMDNFSAYLSARMVTSPVLVIHDKDDDEVPVKCGIHIHKNLQNGELILTEGLGHRKILGDKYVVTETMKFIKEKTYENDHDTAIRPDDTSVMPGTAETEKQS
jgi:pimeloyl-ACP methyl ester carboxylesterase